MNLTVARPTILVAGDGKDLVSIRQASGDEAEGVRELGLVRPGTHDLPPQDRNLMAQH